MCVAWLSFLEQVRGAALDFPRGASSKEVVGGRQPWPFSQLLGAPVPCVLLLALVLTFLLLMSSVLARLCESGCGVALRMRPQEGEACGVSFWICLCWRACAEVALEVLGGCGVVAVSRWVPLGC